MKANQKFGFFIALSWILSLAVAYALGWWNGLSSATRVATGVARSSFPMILVALAVVAVAAAVAAYRARGLLNRGV